MPGLKGIFRFLKSWFCFSLISSLELELCVHSAFTINGSSHGTSFGQSERRTTRFHHFSRAYNIATEHIVYYEI